MKTFKEIRKEKGISIAHVSRLLQKSTITVRNKENGITEFTAPEARTLCKLYGVKFEDVKI